MEYKKAICNNAQSIYVAHESWIRPQSIHCLLSIINVLFYHALSSALSLKPANPDTPTTTQSGKFKEVH